MFSQVLLVEPDAVFGTLLHQAVSDLAEVRCVSHFTAARSFLQQSPVDLLVTNLCLGAFNGFHLVYVATLRATRTRAVEYTEWLDTGFGRDVQRAGAFYETTPCLPHTLASDVGAALPPKDGRKLAVHDRRQTFRGGAGPLIVGNFTDSHRVQRASSDSSDDSTLIDRLKQTTS